jgi:phosphatidylglycerophosphatase A
MAHFGRPFSGRPSRRNAYLTIISFFGVGFISKKMPGTVGSIAATLIAVALPNSNILFWAVSLVTFVVGVWGCDRYIVRHECESDRDPQYAVIDEVCGIFCGYSIMYPFVASLAIRPVVAILTNFVLFRVFDILKPFPIKKLEKMLAKNDNTVGFGIMVDDVFAAAYAALSHGVLLMLWAGYNYLAMR